MAGRRYLNSELKDDLKAAAESVHLPAYTTYNVGPLRENLDHFLQANSTRFAGKDGLNPIVAEYYKREAPPTAKSPVKKIAEKVQGLVKSDDEDAPAAVAKKPRRKTTTSPPADDSTSSAQALVKTPAREVANTLRQAERRTSTILQQAQETAVASPRVVADLVEQRTAEARNVFNSALERLQIAERADKFRDFASSPFAIAFFAIMFEFYGVRKALIPIEKFGSFSLSRGSKQDFVAPNVFVFLEPHKFWAPFSLWALTSLILPLTISYFINLPLKAHSSHSYGTRRATSHAEVQNQYDPFVYFISKALIAYLVYALHLPALAVKLPLQTGTLQTGQANAPALLGIYSNYAISLINAAIPGGYSSIYTTSAIGAAISLYEAALKK